MIFSLPTNYHRRHYYYILIHVNVLVLWRCISGYIYTFIYFFFVFFVISFFLANITIHRYYYLQNSFYWLYRSLLLLLLWLHYFKRYIFYFLPSWNICIYNWTPILLLFYVTIVEISTCQRKIAITLTHTPTRTHMDIYSYTNTIDTRKYIFDIDGWRRWVEHGIEK